jgi:hypothetical protein
MAAGLNSHSDAARVMSVNTIVTSPCGARAGPASPAAPTGDSLDACEDDDEPVEAADAFDVGMLHEL